jgi:hypothetical protein
MIGLLTIMIMGAPTPDSVVVTPWFTGPSHWFPVPVILRTAESDKLTACVKPTMTFRTDAAEILRNPYELCGLPRAGFGSNHARPTGSLVQAPDAPGTYELDIGMTRGPNLVSQAKRRTIWVMPLPAYVAAMLGIFLALLVAGWGAATTSNRRRRQAIIVALALLSPLWVPQLMGGHTMFLGLMCLIVWFYRAGQGATVFLLATSCATAVFLELYWGSVTSNANWTAWVLSVTLLWMIYRLMKLIVRKPSALAIFVWVGALALALIDVSQAIYKSFFLDYGSVTILGTTGQVGQLLDSIGRVVTLTHVMSVLIPLVLPILALRLRSKSRPSQSSPTIRSNKSSATT